ncbi:NHL repeat-containing protein [Streptomyces alkaliphilus]|uniref:hypothetical protein n=1 Tax=Streptomyces alkaliphilus TaxID=1472722 RepID=UPI0015FA4710|nr:hypothetical protein [Streptomyces alkaliphilus]
MTLSVDIAGMNMPLVSPTSLDGQHAAAVAEGVITSVEYTEAESHSRGGDAPSNRFNQPAGVVVARDGTLFVAENSGHRVRKVTPDGRMFTVAGNGTEGDEGDNGPAAQAQLRGPWALALDAEGNVYVSEKSRVRKVTPDGKITTVVADMKWPRGLACDSSGNLYIAEYGRHRVRKVTPDGKMTTVAGTTDHGGFNGDEDNAAGASLYEPTGLCLDEIGNLYIVDHGNHRVRKVAPDGIITTVAGAGSNPDVQNLGDGGPADKAALFWPYGVVRDIYGNLYITANDRVRKVTPNGIINSAVFVDEDNEKATMAELKNPAGLALDQYGNLYIADRSNDRVLKVAGPRERSLMGRQVNVPQAGLGEIAELTVEFTAYRAGRAVDAKNVVQTFTAPTGFAFAEWPTYSYNGNDAWRGSLGCRFERDRSVMLVTSNLHLNTCTGDKGPLLYTIPVKAVAAVDPGTYHDGRLIVGRSPGIGLSATVTGGPQFSVTPGSSPVEMMRGDGPTYPGVGVHREGPVPPQTITATLPPGAGLAFKPECGDKHQMTVGSREMTRTKNFDAELSEDGQTLTCQNVDLDLSQQHPGSAVWVAVTAAATAAIGTTRLTFRVGGIESASTDVKVISG